MPRKPDYKVAALDKSSRDQANVGAAWKNKDGSIAVILNAFVILTGKKSLLITLFPEKEEPPEEEIPF